MISLFLPVATEIETKRERAWHQAALAAIAAVFSKGDVGRSYAASLEKVLELVESEQLSTRETSGGRHAIAAQKLMDAILPLMTRK